MESANQANVTNRDKQRANWLRCQGVEQKLTPMAGDASTRLYFRVKRQGQSCVLMDAPPEEHDNQRFIELAGLLSEHDIKVPEIIAADEQAGFMLLSDLGDQTYLKALNQQNADQLYTAALSTLSRIQAIASQSGINLQSFDRSWFAKEWGWYQQWFLKKYLQLELDDWLHSLNECIEAMTESHLSQPQVFMHRDYHAANLMWVEGEVGVLDFQDAFRGPVTYDLASLLRDCYVAWPEHKVTFWLEKYYYTLRQHEDILDGVDLAVFARWFDWMSVQRHLKAIMTFSRKHLRDNDARYLQYIPATLSCIVAVTARYKELEAMHRFTAQQVIPRFNDIRAEQCER